MTQRLFRRFGFAVAVAAVSAGVYVTLGSAAGTASPPDNSSPPTISGTPLVGKTLTAANGSWSGTNPMTFSHQWQRCSSSGGNCGAIGSATGQTYTVQGADVGHTLRVAVTATNADGTGGPVLSSATDVVTAASAPVNTSEPQLTGTLKEGSTLSVTSGTWTGTAPIAYAYQWQRCNSQGKSCSAFKSGTTTYALVKADVGNRIQVRVTATNSGGSASRYSNQTGVIGANAVAPANTATPQLTGTLVEGQTLHVTGGSWSGTDPITLSYQWQRCNGQGSNCAPIAGASGEAYTLTSADIGARLQVYVTATNAGGSASKYSNQVGPVARSTAAVPASSVNLPNRLIVDRIQYPAGGHSRTPFSARFHVTDTTGHAVSGALVYVIGLPYAWLRSAPEQATDGAGWATFTLVPTVKMPRTGALVMFVRARTPQGNVLAGASTRRLVQVRVRP